MNLAIMQNEGRLRPRIGQVRRPEEAPEPWARREGFGWRTSLSQSIRLLIAHPNRDLRSLLVRSFREAGCVVDVVDDGLGLLDWLADVLLAGSHDARPDLIVASLGLPHRHGARLLADLRAAGWSTPFVLTADGPCKPQDARVRSYGRVVLFESPFEIYDLLTAAFLLVDQARRLPVDPPGSRSSDPLLR